MPFDSMMPGLHAEYVLLRHRLRKHGIRHDVTSGKIGRANVVWWRGVSALAAAYIIASQALLDVTGWSASAFVFAILLASVVVAGVLCRIWKIRIGKWIAVPLLFLGYCLLRCFSEIKDTSPFDTFVQMTSAFLGGITLALALRAGVKFATIVYAQLSANLLQIIIVLSGVGPEAPPGEDSFRYAGLTGNPNALALQLTLGACLIWLMPRKAGVFPCVFAVASVAFAVAVTGSRKAVLIAFFFLILMLIQTVHLAPRKRRRLMTALAVTVPCITGMVLGPWLYQHGQEIAAVQRVVDYEDSSFQTRADMIQQGLHLWSQAPVFGNGLDAFEGLSGQGTYAHNNYVELLCDLGIVGTVLFYSMYGLVLIRAARVRLFLKLYCWVFALALLLADVGYVSFRSKQTIMILMILIVATTSHHLHKHRRSERENGGGTPEYHGSKLRRFVVRT
ncbi:MAG TPA: O-antigen ligase family protein [Candidatus Paceibacterota bacterium]|nr:O-antigen ligase family protein [Candidatus Paceibacterota bacterium]